MHADEDQTVSGTYQAAEDEEQEQDAEEDEEIETDGRAERPPSSVAAPPTESQQQSQKSRDEIAMEQALAKYSAQLELGSSHVRTCL